MPDFSFLNENGNGDGWTHDPIEHIETPIVDSRGRSIGFDIVRGTYSQNGVPAKYWRSICVTHDGQRVRSDDSYHDSQSDAEDEVTRHIQRSMDRYRALYGQPRDSALPVIVTKPHVNRVRANQATLEESLKSCGSNLMGCGCLLVLLALLLAIPLILIGG